VKHVNHVGGPPVVGLAANAPFFFVHSWFCFCFSAFASTYTQPPSISSCRSGILSRVVIKSREYKGQNESYHCFARPEIPHLKSDKLSLCSFLSPRQYFVIFDAAIRLGFFPVSWNPLIQGDASLHALRVPGHWVQWLTEDGPPNYDKILSCHYPRG
jgi:hypothetical protein